MAEIDIDRQYLQQHWMHSHEEDTASEMVFRPVTYKFPRSRGRIGYEFKSNGKCTITGFGPTDRSQKSGSKWELNITDHIEIIVKLKSGEIHTLKVITISRDKLVMLRK
jgi:hypothetical protein